MKSPNEPSRVLILLGSPRKKGNSAALAEAIGRGAKSAGAKVETVYLNGLKIGPCQACYACRKKGAKSCAIDDDMQALYPKLIEARAWVIASPVYWFNMSAQTKLFIDRCFALWNTVREDLAGRRIAVAMSYEDIDPFTSGCVNALRSFQDAFRYVGAEITGMVYGSAAKPGEIKGNTELMKRAEELGRDLVRPD
ncbi:MAG: flavodoxin family protein [Thermodesulfobacteriota bacterium]